MRRRLRIGPLLVCLMALLLGGCELLPDEPFARQDHNESVKPVSSGCKAVLPNFNDVPCLLSDWIAFGLASQRGDHEWRNDMLTRLQAETAERRLARAIVLTWGSENEWDHASELYKADLHAAPVELQPLLRYWLNELEGRRAMSGRLASSQQEIATLEEENAALDEKLEALTDIERNINLRQQIDEEETRQ
ncbi:hypothetical protein [Halomonas korlensis]|uniref:YfhG lipoprotein n=1 Tax=Halomonas korlensis TaxID=463301 RepID=A0A1I7HB79_9GAMM|nr:hypothetical protein [Halomonas korlensis]SFU57852.1 hypothetical protein SAMN04487955_104110 [Halomonas korlensis]